MWACGPPSECCQGRGQIRWICGVDASWAWSSRLRADQNMPAHWPRSACLPACLPAVPLGRNGKENGGRHPCRGKGSHAGRRRRLVPICVAGTRSPTSSWPTARRAVRIQNERTSATAGVISLAPRLASEQFHRETLRSRCVHGMYLCEQSRYLPGTYTRNSKRSQPARRRWRSSQQPVKFFIGASAELSWPVRAARTDHPALSGRRDRSWKCTGRGGAGQLSRSVATCGDSGQMG